MCGIAGFYRKSLNIQLNTSVIKKMTDAIAHRGPDAEGQWHDDVVALGHRRLSIIDLTEDGTQPMHSHDGRFVITYNGEVYNYLELKKDLKRKGHIFRTRTDTEVIIEAYREYGEECFSLFNGMWALVLYDRRDGKLVVSRDRFGVKPLYSVDDEEVFIFASEMKAILAAFPKYCQPNVKWIYRYLSDDAVEDSDEETIYKNINIFPPSTYMVYHLKSNEKVINKYWEVDEELFYKKWIEGKIPEKTFRSLFEDAIRLRLRADVEVGACLSGGIDSSSIVGCVAKKYGKKLHTFSSIYMDEECNEEVYIRAVNEKWNTSPHYVKPDKDEGNLDRYIKEITWYHDQPTLSASLFSQYKVMEEARKHVKVVLDGQGADELFAGYLHYYFYYISDLLGKGTLYCKLKAIRLMAIIKEEWPHVMDSIPTDVIVGIVGIDLNRLFCNKKSVRQLKTKRMSSMFTEAFMKRIKNEKKEVKVKLSSKLNTKLCNDIITDSIPCLLHNEDGNSMAFSIESRVPFLDYRIVEFSLALDGKYKIRNQWTKWIVRRSLETYLPQKIKRRKNKMGFPAPFARWLRNGKSKDGLRERIYVFGKRGIVPSNTIDAYYKAHMKGGEDHSLLLFRFYSLEMWFEIIEEKYGFKDMWF